LIAVRVRMAWAAWWIIRRPSGDGPGAEQDAVLSVG
jgi:hypothetical protein